MTPDAVLRWKVLLTLVRKDILKPSERHVERSSIYGAQPLHRNSPREAPAFRPPRRRVVEAVRRSRIVCAGVVDLALSRRADAGVRLRGRGRVLEIFVNTPVEECRRRDPNELYRHADAGQIRDFTGVDGPRAAARLEIRLPTFGTPPVALAERVVDELLVEGA